MFLWYTNQGNNIVWHLWYLCNIFCTLMHPLPRQFGLVEQFWEDIGLLCKLGEKIWFGLANSWLDLANLWVGQICGFWAGVGCEAPWGGFGGGRQAEQLDQHCPLPPPPPRTTLIPFPFPNHYRQADEKENWRQTTLVRHLLGGCLNFFRCLSLWGGERDIWAVQSDMFTGDHPLTLLRWPAPGWNLSSLPLSYYSLVSLPHSLGHWKWDLTTLIHMVCCKIKSDG